MIARPGHWCGADTRIHSEPEPDRERTAEVFRVDLIQGIVDQLKYSSTPDSLNSFNSHCRATVICVIGERLSTALQPTCVPAGELWTLGAAATIDKYYPILE